MAGSVSDKHQPGRSRRAKAFLIRLSPSLDVVGVRDAATRPNFGESFCHSAFVADRPLFATGQPGIEVERLIRVDLLDNRYHPFGRFRLATAWRVCLR